MARIIKLKKGKKFMYNFVFDIPTRILFGAGQLNNLHKEKLPGQKALVAVSNGQSTKKYGYLQRLEGQLKKAGIEYVLFDKVRPNPTAQNVMDGAKLAKENGCDFVISLGGGSVMDCGKCIALMMKNDGDLWDYSLSRQGGKKIPRNAAVPNICITTSAGTGSEVNAAAIISRDDLEEKTLFLRPSMYPSISIVDSDLMLSVPPKYTAYQGMDAFFHASETIMNKNVHPMAEMFALKAIELLSKYLPIAYKDGENREARYYAALANTLACYYVMSTSAHNMEHVMSGFHPELAHGAGLIMISPSYYEFFIHKGLGEDRFIKMAKAMGVDNPASGKDFLNALNKLIADVGCVDIKMSQIGITKEELKKYPAKVFEVLGGDITADLISLSEKDYLKIYEDAYR